MIFCVEPTPAPETMPPMPACHACQLVRSEKRVRYVHLLALRSRGNLQIRTRSESARCQSEMTMRHRQARRSALKRQFIRELKVKNRTGLFCIVLTLSLQTMAWAADPVEGERFARRVCSTCHSIAAGQSPMAAAPPFASIAHSKNFRIQGSGLFFKSHLLMPNFAFTNEQAEDVTAYLKTLARRRVRY